MLFVFSIKDFEWDEGNQDKNLIKHGVTTDEAEEIFYRNPYLRKAQNNLYYAFGATEDGRYLFAVFLLKPGRIARIISVRDMDASEKRFYKSHRKGK